MSTTYNNQEEKYSILVSKMKTLTENPTPNELNYQNKLTGNIGSRCMVTEKIFKKCQLSIEDNNVDTTFAYKL